MTINISTILTAIVTVIITALTIYTALTISTAITIIIVAVWAPTTDSTLLIFDYFIDVHCYITLLLTAASGRDIQVNTTVINLN